MIGIVVGLAEVFKYYILFIVHVNKINIKSNFSDSLIYSLVFFISRIIILVLPGEDTLIAIILNFRGLSYITTDSILGIVIGSIIAFSCVYFMKKWKNKIIKRSGTISNISYYWVLFTLIILQII
ncbi:MAG: hypothetical protein KAG94_06830 [Clostridiales bacterium]|nr:hypothetical protein [Clostridiales bacterium]